MYEVIEYFEDMQDSNYVYCPGDKFPRHGKEVSIERINELLSSDNRRGKAVIREIGKGEKKAVSVQAEPKEDAPKADKKYSQEELEAMKVNEIGNAAKAAGLEINTFGKKKADLVAEFLEKQG